MSFKETTPKLKFSKLNLKAILESNPFRPYELISLLEKQFPNTFHKDVGVWEGYTLRQHTIMVLNQHEKYFAHRVMPFGLDKNIFRLILALHDIGKPEAIANGGKHLQHEFTHKYIKSFFPLLCIDKKHTALALVLTSDNPIGSYIKKKKSSTEIRKIIEQMAESTNMPFDDIFELLCIFFKLDAGSYTENAGGKKSLDHLFIFDEKNKNIDLSPDIKKRIDLI